MTTTGTATLPRPLRADAKRNYDRIMAAADVSFREHGPSASMDEIARRAGVGPGTLYRHFPTREDLLLEFFTVQVEELGAEADRLLGSDDPGAALAAWLRTKMLNALTYRGLSAEVMNNIVDSQSEVSKTCIAMRGTSEALLRRARDAGAIRPDAEYADVMKMVNAIGLATERTPAGDEQACRLLELVMDGLQIKR